MNPKKSEVEARRWAEYQKLIGDVALWRALFASARYSDISAINELSCSAKILKKELADFCSKTGYFCRDCSRNNFPGNCCSSAEITELDEFYWAVSIFEFPDMTFSPQHFRLRCGRYDESHKHVFYCAFLGEQGCALKEDRPFGCLTYTCHKLAQVMDKQALKGLKKRARKLNTLARDLKESIIFRVPLMS